MLVGVIRRPSLMPAALYNRVARGIGHLGAFLRDFPSLNAWRLDCEGWRIIYVGKPAGLEAVKGLFAPVLVAQHPLGELPLWRFRSRSAQWLDEGADLVIKETGWLMASGPAGAVTFSIPTWINQRISIDQPIDKLLSGKKREPMRRKIRKLREAGFNWRTSTSREDFDHFYQRMYLPFVRSRHEDGVIVSAAESFWELWLARRNGVLLLITDKDKPVAGMLCSIVDDTCYSLEGGVLDASPELFQRGVWSFLNAGMMEWGHQQGASYFNFGGTRSWRSNSVFESKRRWGSEVVERPRPVTSYTFVGNSIKPPLQSHINSIGFIGVKDGEAWACHLADDLDNVAGEQVEALIQQASKSGLAGVQLIGAEAGGGERYVKA
jgi:hypothetical protein